MSGIRWCDTARLANVIKSIYEIYRPYIERKGKRPKGFKSSHIKHQIKGSAVTLFKARKCLGIKSIKIASDWYWAFPTRTLEQSLDYALNNAYLNNPDSRQLKIRQDTKSWIEDQIKTAAENLRDGFKQYDYVLTPTLAKSFLKDMGVTGLTSGTFYSRVKKEVGFKRLHVFDPIYGKSIWIWVWIDNEVIVWLDETIDSRQGIITKDELYSLGLKNNWIDHVINAAVVEAGYYTHKEKGKWCIADSDHLPQDYYKSVANYDEAALEEAEKFITSILLDKPMKVSQLFKEAKRAGIRRSLLLEAKTKIGIKVDKDNSGEWVWLMPSEIRTLDRE